MINAYGIARIGRDVEVRHTAKGDAVANVSLAFNYGMKDGDGNRPTQWVEASLWGQRAESLAQYLMKGTAVCVTLEDLHSEEYQKKDGTQGSKLVGRISNLEFAGGKQDSAPASAPAPKAAQKAAAGGSGFDDMTDDIPFLNVGRGIAGHTYWG